MDNQEIEIEDEADDIRRGMTDAQWAIYQRATTGYGEQSESGIDVSLLRENLKLTPTQRLAKLQDIHNFFVAADNARLNRNA